MEQTSQTVLEILTSLGLELSEKTGGYLHEENTLTHATRTAEKGLFMSTDSGQQISVLDGAIFLKSITSTEKSLKIKLFV